MGGVSTGLEQLQLMRAAGMHISYAAVNTSDMNHMGKALKGNISDPSDIALLFQQVGN